MHMYNMITIINHFSLRTQFGHSRPLSTIHCSQFYHAFTLLCCIFAVSYFHYLLLEFRRTLMCRLSAFSTALKYINSFSVFMRLVLCK